MADVLREYLDRGPPALAVCSRARARDLCESDPEMRELFESSVPFAGSGGVSSRARWAAPGTAAVAYDPAEYGGVPFHCPPVSRVLILEPKEPAAFWVHRAAAGSGGAVEVTRINPVTASLVRSGEKKR
jgi:hypothetical protein